MTLEPGEVLREIGLQGELVALAAVLEAASAAQYGESLARTAAELRRLAETLTPHGT